MTTWIGAGYKRKDGTIRFPKGTKNLPPGTIVKLDSRGRLTVVDVEPPHSNSYARDKDPRTKAALKRKAKRALRKAKEKKKMQIRERLKQKL